MHRNAHKSNWLRRYLFERLKSSSKFIPWCYYLSISILTNFIPCWTFWIKLLKFKIRFLNSFYCWLDYFWALFSFPAKFWPYSWLLVILYLLPISWIIFPNCLIYVRKASAAKELNIKICSLSIGRVPVTFIIHIGLTIQATAKIIDSIPTLLEFLHFFCC